MAIVKEKAIIANVPQLLEKEPIQVYIPKASTTEAGIASFRKEDFFVDPKGEVSLSKSITLVDKKADEAINTANEAINTANAAKEIAESAMDMVSCTECTRITVNGEFEPEMDVEGDIQTQFNNITSKIPLEASEENQLADKNYTQSRIHDLLSTQIILGMEGVIEANRVVFTVQDSESFIGYRTNSREFFITAYLPVVVPTVDSLDLSMPVNITFGDTTYNLYNYMLGTATTMTIGQLMSTHSYTQQHGFFFNFKATFFQNSDIVGFAIIPPAIIALQLDNIIANTDTITKNLTSDTSKLAISVNLDGILGTIYPVDHVVIKWDDGDYSNWLGFNWEKIAAESALGNAWRRVS